MNRFALYTFTMGGILAVAGQVTAQAPTPAKPSPPKSAAPAATDSGKAVAPTDSGITAPPDPNRVVLTVGDEKMTASQFEEMVRSFPPNVQQAAHGPQRRDLVNQIVQMKVLAQEAERRKLEQKPEIKQQLALQKENLLANSLFQDLAASVKITDADAEAYYNVHKSEFESAKAHHVLIRVKGSQMPAAKDKPELTDEEALAKAKEAQKRLLAGEPFEKVAKEMSDDTSPNGDLGTFSKGNMVPPFDEAAFTLPVGKISDPIKTVYGYHIIRVDSREAKTFAEARPLFEPKVKAELAKKQMEDLRAKANVQIDDTFFKPVGGAPPKAQ